MLQEGGQRLLSIDIGGVGGRAVYIPGPGTSGRKRTDWRIVGHEHGEASWD